jgi:hypothetical protein
MDEIVLYETCERQCLRDRFLSIHEYKIIYWCLWSVLLYFVELERGCEWLNGKYMREKKWYLLKVSEENV